VPVFQTIRSLFALPALLDLMFLPSPLALSGCLKNLRKDNKAQKIRRSQPARIMYAGGLLFAVCGQAQAASLLVPHRAVYDLSVIESRETAGISSGNGRLVYEFTRQACNGFKLTYRQVMKVKPAEGPESLIDFRSTTFEDDAAAGFTFDNSNTVNGNTDTVLKGQADRQGTQVNIVLEKPEERTLKLTGNMLFPTQHLQNIIAAAREGKSLLEAYVFDGSGKADAAAATLSLIGAAQQGGDKDFETAAQKDSMAKIRYWPVTISYFDPSASSAEQTPKFVFGADLYENGVARNLKLDYGSFVVAGKLVGLEYFPDDAQKPCGK
jgi:hypothetical protein